LTGGHKEGLVGDDGRVDGLLLARDDILPVEQLEEQHLDHSQAPSKAEPLTGGRKTAKNHRRSCGRMGK